MSTNATQEKRPFAQIRENSRVNRPGEWRFRCPEGHTTITWTSKKGTKVICHGCGMGASNYGTWESYPVEAVVDLKTGRALAELVEEHDAG